MYKQRTPRELTLYLASKKKVETRRKEKIAKRNADIKMHREFKSHNIKLDKYITYYCGSVYLNKKALNRLIKEANSKWTPSN